MEKVTDMIFNGQEFIEIDTCIEDWAGDNWLEMDDTFRSERAYALPGNCGMGKLVETSNCEI